MAIHTYNTIHIDMQNGSEQESEREREPGRCSPIELMIPVCVFHWCWFRLVLWVRACVPIYVCVCVCTKWKTDCFICSGRRILCGSIRILPFVITYWQHALRTRNVCRNDEKKKNEKKIERASTNELIWDNANASERDKRTNGTERERMTKGESEKMNTLSHTPLALFKHQQDTQRCGGEAARVRADEDQERRRSKKKKN